MPAYQSAELRRFYNIDGIGIPEMETPSRWPRQKRAWFDERKAEWDRCPQISTNNKLDGLLSANELFDVLKGLVRYTA